MKKEDPKSYTINCPLCHIISKVKVETKTRNVKFNDGHGMKTETWKEQYLTINCPVCNNEWTVTLLK
jgi:C4-type Zn-finger protein